jgi:hypothetical protein
MVTMVGDLEHLIRLGGPDLLRTIFYKVAPAAACLRHRKVRA